MEGILSDNLIDFVLDVGKEACEAACNNMSACNFYTHHNQQSETYPNTCFFLTELRGVIQLKKKWFRAIFGASFGSKTQANFWGC